VLHVRYQRGAGEYTCRDSGHVRVLQGEADDLVEALVVRRLADPTAYPQLTRRDTSGQLQAARDELAAIRAHHKDMTRLLAQRKISPQAFSAAEPDVLAAIEAAAERVRSLEAPPVLRMLLGGPGDDVAARWQAAPMAARREIVRILFARIAAGRAPAPGQRGPVTERLSIEWAAS
jgi:hypothetical protein